jgi:hypothetical protein
MIVFELNFTDIKSFMIVYSVYSFFETMLIFKESESLKISIFKVYFLFHIFNKHVKFRRP